MKKHYAHKHSENCHYYVVIDLNKGYNTYCFVEEGNMFTNMHKESGESYE